MATAFGSTVRQSLLNRNCRRVGSGVAWQSPQSFARGRRALSRGRNVSCARNRRIAHQFHRGPFIPGYEANHAQSNDSVCFHRSDALRLFDRCWGTASGDACSARFHVRNICPTLMAPRKFFERDRCGGVGHAALASRRSLRSGVSAHVSFGDFNRHPGRADHDADATSRFVATDSRNALPAIMRAVVSLVV